MEPSYQKSSEPRGAAARNKRASGSRPRKSPHNADKAATRGRVSQKAATVRPGDARAMYIKWVASTHSYDELAEEYGLTPRQVARICDELRAHSVDAFEATDSVGPIEHIDRVLVQLEHSVGVAARILAATMEERDWKASVAAHRRVAEARRELIEMKQYRGVLPTDLSTVGDQWDAMRMVAIVTAEFERFDIPMEVHEALREATNVDASRLKLVDSTGDGDGG